MSDCGNISVWIAVISGGAALIGALGSQGIASWLNLHSKKLELIYKYKGEAYADFLASVAEFALDPKNPEKYIRYLSVYEKALVFASDEVASALTDHNGVNVAAQRLRAAKGESDLQDLQIKDWHDAIRRAAAAMRVDITKYS